MHYLLIFFTIGNFFVAFWPDLPRLQSVALLLPATLVLFCFRRLRLLACLLLGVVYAVCWGNQRLDDRLPAVLDGRDVQIKGVVHGLPEADARRTKFLLAVDQAETISSSYSLNGKRLLLSWYGATGITTGDRLDLSVRLRSPRGFANPGGMDYSEWLLRNGIAATGYVRQGKFEGRTGNGLAGILSGWRYRLQLAIEALPQPAPVRGLIVALVVGNKANIPGATWQLLVNSGTVHLAVVSGLHIGMVASFGCGLGWLLGRLLVLTGLLGSGRVVSLAVGWFSALLYGLLADFALPAQRALVMLTAAVLLLALRRRVNPWHGLVWSALAVSLLDPLAILTPGFWLSFAAVAALLFWFVPRPRRRWFVQLPVAQVIVFIGLFGCLLFFQGRVSLVAPLANLIAVPWLSVLIVPLLLLGALIDAVLPAAAERLWLLGGGQLEMFVGLLEAISADLAAWQWQPSVSINWALMLGASVSVFMLLMPGRLGLRSAGLVLLAAILLGRSEQPGLLRAAVLDVGQGLAVVIRAGSRTLVYDAGPVYSARFDAGSGIVTPFLRRIGVRTIDTLVISHGDNDHAGGLNGLLDNFPVARLLTGDSAIAGPSAMRCMAGQQWRWEGVDFQILHPGRSVPLRDNNRSCVLLIRKGPVGILLPGDIEQDVERQLLSSGALPRHLTLLVAPHHGSNSSSSEGFVNQLAPAHVVYATGFKHHFGHPHAMVRARYQRQGSEEWLTAESGALFFTWDAAGRLSIGEQRQRLRRYWHP